jgi:hypothetical protein
MRPFYVALPIRDALRLALSWAYYRTLFVLKMNGKENGCQLLTNIKDEG